MDTYTLQYSGSEIDNKLQLVDTLNTNLSDLNQLVLSGQIPYLTTAPVADNTAGFLKFVVLNAEPATKYNGYLYIIVESQNS